MYLYIYTYIRTYLSFVYMYICIYTNFSQDDEIDSASGPLYQGPACADPAGGSVGPSRNKDHGNPTLLARTMATQRHCQTKDGPWQPNATGKLKTNCTLHLFLPTYQHHHH
jgi:hypothetical protein